MFLETSNLSTHILALSSQPPNSVSFIHRLCISACSLLQSLLQEIMPFSPYSIRLSECSLLQSLLQKTIMQRYFAYITIKSKSPQTLTAQGLFADGVKWTRTIDPHDVNVEKLHFRNNLYSFSPKELAALSRFHGGVWRRWFRPFVYPHVLINRHTALMLHRSHKAACRM